MKTNVYHIDDFMEYYDVDLRVDKVNAQTLLTGSSIPERKQNSTITLEGCLDLLEEAIKGENGDKIKRLFDGDHSDYPSHSEGDMAFCSYLTLILNGDAAKVSIGF